MSWFAVYLRLYILILRPLRVLKFVYEKKKSVFSIVKDLKVSAFIEHFTETQKTHHTVITAPLWGTKTLTVDLDHFLIVHTCKVTDVVRREDGLFLNMMPQLTTASRFSPSLPRGCSESASPHSQQAFVIKFINPTCLPHAGASTTSHLHKQRCVVEHVIWLASKNAMQQCSPNSFVCQIPPGLSFISFSWGIFRTCFNLMWFLRLSPSHCWTLLKPAITDLSHNKRVDWEWTEVFWTTGVACGIKPIHSLGFKNGQTQIYFHFSKYLKCENCLCVLRTNENVLLM